MLWGTGGDLRMWGSQYWWNNQGAYFNGFTPANRPELMGTVFLTYSRMFDSLSRAAREQWGSQGVWIPEACWFDGLEPVPQGLVAEMQDIYLAKKPWSERSREFMDFAQDKNGLNHDHSATVHCRAHPSPIAHGRTGILRIGYSMRFTTWPSGDRRTEVKKENFMKIASIIARYLFALIFIVFGLNGFLHFLPMKPPSSELAMQYFTVMFTSHYLVFIFSLQLIAGILLLFRRTVPLALTIAGPLIVNILLFHVLMDPRGIVPGLLVTALWFIIFSQYHAAFHGILFGERQ